MNTLDLSRLTEGGRVHNLTGRDLGRRAREEYEISRLDDAEGSVEVVVPEDVFLITPSFFIGMFSQSVIRLGSVEAFFDKYNFRSPPQVLRQIHDAARRTLIVARRTA